MNVFLTVNQNIQKKKKNEIVCRHQREVITNLKLFKDYNFHFRPASYYLIRKFFFFCLEISFGIQQFTETQREWLNISKFQLVFFFSFKIISNTNSFHTDTNFYSFFFLPSISILLWLSLVLLQKKIGPILGSDQR